MIQRIRSLWLCALSSCNVDPLRRLNVSRTQIGACGNSPEEPARSLSNGKEKLQGYAITW
jgi:hypothetical protein